MKSTLKNMVLTLLAITLVAGTALSIVYSMTKGRIEASKNARTTGALRNVIPPFDNDPSLSIDTLMLDGMEIRVYTGTLGGRVTGYAVESMTRSGYSGDIVMMVGFAPDGTIHNIEVLQQNETPGLGSKIADADNPLLLSFRGRNPAELNMAVRKEGGDIDAITASTISSRAYIDAVKRAFTAFEAVARGADTSVDHIGMVLPGYGNASAPVSVDVGGSTADIYTVYKGGELFGYAIQSMSGGGFRGVIRLMVGFTPQGEITGIAAVEQNETQGWGSVIGSDDNPLLLSLKGRNPSQINMSLRKDGGDVDGITSSTITSKAYIEAVARAHEAFRSITLTGEDVK